MRQHIKDAFERGRAWWDSNFLGTSLLKMYEIDGRNRAITLAGQAFIALVPLLIVLASWNLGTGDQGLGDAIVDYFNLQGSTADAVQTLCVRYRLVVIVAYLLVATAVVGAELGAWLKRFASAT